MTRANVARLAQQQQQQEAQRRNSIISQMAEKVAAVNQLVAETQGTKSLNASPIPVSLKSSNIVGGATQNSVLIQKPVAILPAGAPLTAAQLARRCVTVCEDPVKAIHLQQQHAQLRAQLANLQAAGTIAVKGRDIIAAGGTLVRSHSKPRTATTAAHHQTLQQSHTVPFSPSAESLSKLGKYFVHSQFFE